MLTFSDSCQHFVEFRMPKIQHAVHSILLQVNQLVFWNLTFRPKYCVYSVAPFMWIPSLVNGNVIWTLQAWKWFADLGLTYIFYVIQSMCLVLCPLLCHKWVYSKNRGQRTIGTDNMVYYLKVISFDISRKFIICKLQM